MLESKTFDVVIAFHYCVIEQFMLLGKKCLEPVYEVENSTHTIDGITFNDTVTYKCITGHEFPDGEAEKTFHCQLDETWENITQPFCKGLYSISICRKHLLLACYLLFMFL